MGKKSIFVKKNLHGQCCSCLVISHIRCMYYGKVSGISQKVGNFGESFSSFMLNFLAVIKFFAKLK